MVDWFVLVQRMFAYYCYQAITNVVFIYKRKFFRIYYFRLKLHLYKSCSWHDQENYNDNILPAEAATDPDM